MSTAELDLARDRRAWEALPAMARRLARAAGADTAAAYDALLTGELVLRRALAAWDDINPVDHAACEMGAPAGRPRVREPIPLARVETAVKTLEACPLEDAKLLVAILRVDSSTVNDAAMATLANAPAPTPVSHVLPLQTLLAKAVLLSKTGALAEAAKPLAAVRDFALANRALLAPGSYTLALAEEAMFRLAFLQHDLQNVDAAELALQQCLELPHVADGSKRVAALFNYARLIAKSRAFEDLAKHPRRPEERDEFRAQNALLLDAVQWLETSGAREAFAADAVTRAFFAALDVLNVTAALPAVVRAAEIGMRLLPYHEGLAFTYARALIHSHKYHEALAVLRACMSKNELLVWMATWLCLVPLRLDPQVAADYAEHGLKLGSKYMARFHHAIAVARERQAAAVHDIDEKQRLQHEALAALKAARAADADSWEIEYHLALHLAHQRKIKSAVSHIKSAIVLNDDNPDLWNLLVLLCTCNRDFAAADQFCLQALERHKHDVSLYLTWTLIQGYLHGLPREVASLRNLFNRMPSTKRSAADDQLARVLSMSDVSESGKSSVAKRRSNTFSRAFGRFAARAVAQTSESEQSETPPAPGGDAMSLDSSVMGAMSAVSADGGHPAVHGDQVREALLWTHAGHAYLRMGNMDDALLCIHTACSLEATLPDAWCLHGEFVAAQSVRDTDEVLAFFYKALALNSTHVPSLVGSGRILHKAGRLALAHQHLTAAVNLDEHDAAAWLALGRVYRALGEKTTASDCLLRAFAEERITPVRPFSRTWTMQTGTEAWQL